MTSLDASQSPDNAPASLDPGQPNGPNKASKPRKPSTRRATLTQDKRTVNATGQGKGTVCDAVERETATDSATVDKVDAAKLDTTYGAAVPVDERARAVNIVLDKMSNGATYRRACKESGYPGATIWRWMGCSGELMERYTRAREGLARNLADETLEIGDAATPEDVQVAKLRTDTRKWLASKLLPREYGEKLDVEQRGYVANLNLNALSDEQIRRLAGGESALSVLAGAAQSALGSGEVVEEGS